MSEMHEKLRAYNVSFSLTLYKHEADKLLSEYDALLSSDKWAVLRSHVEQARHHARLSLKYMKEAEKAEAQRDALRVALQEIANNGPQPNNPKVWKFSPEWTRRIAREVLALIDGESNAKPG